VVGTGIHVGDLTDFLDEYVSGSAASYLLIVTFVALDALFPLIPAEVVLISGTLFALQGRLTLALVYAAGVMGVLIGDNASYLLGDTLGEPAAERLAHDRRARRWLRWARTKICRHGPGLVVASRFLPGGRTATTFAAGSLGLSWRRFIVADIVAALLAIGYMIAVAYVAGRAFANSFWPSLMLSLGIAVSLFLLFQSWQRLRRVAAR
jgi:membrane-associated protein